MRSAIVFIAVAWLISAQAFGQRFSQTFNNVSELLSANPNTIHTRANLLGFYSANDGGGGPVYFDPDSSAATNQGTIFKPNNYNGRWYRIIENSRTSSKQWGVMPGSVTAEKVAILNSAIAWNAANGYETLLDTGDHRPQTNIVLVSNSRIVGAPESVWLRDYVLQSRYDKALFSIANAPFPTDPAVTSVPIVATNVSMQNVIVGAVSTNKLGPLIAFLGVNYGRIQNCEVRPGAYDWSITWYGNNGIITGNRIKSVFPDSGSTIFTDGVHVLGGTNGVIANNSLETGDDNIAFTTFNNVGISHWTVSGNSHKSWRANALRFQQESAYATNLIQHISITGGTGEAGLLRNGTILFYNPSATNNPYPFRNISISHYKLRGGGLDGQPTPIGLSYGIYANGVDGLTLDDVTLDNTPYGNYILGCKDVTLIHCKASGGLATSGFVAPMRVENCTDLSVIGGRYVPVRVDVAAFQVISVTNTIFSGGTYLHNFSSLQPTLIFNGNNGTAKVMGAKIVSPQTGLNFITDPLNAVVFANHISAPVPIFWTATGSAPVGSRVHWNYNIPEAETVATTFDVLVPNNTVSLGSFGQRGPRIMIQSTNGLITFAQDKINGGSKNVRLGFQPSDDSKFDNALAYSSDNGTATQLIINGGSSLYNAHQNLYINVATNSYDGGGVPMALFTYRGLRLESGVNNYPFLDSLFMVGGTTKGSRPVPSLTTAQANAITPTDQGMQFYDTDERSPSVSVGASTSLYRYLLPRISADRGDNSVTLTSTDPETQLFNTPLTANRAVTLPATNVRKGDRFRIVRTGTGAFSLNVGGLKTIPDSTAATVDVQHNGTVWQLAGYMEHSPSGGGGGGGVPTGRLVNTQHSLTGGGDLSADRTLSLVNDTASPGANKVYGTDGSGVRGWKNDPAGGGGAGYGGTSTTSVSFGTGSKTWTTQTGLAYIAGSRIRAVDVGSSQWMEGEIISYSGGTLTVNVDLFSGIGTYSNWGFSIAGVRGAQGIGFVDADYGDVTIGSGVTSITIDNGAVSYAKMQNVSAASKLLGRGSAGGSGSPQEITIGAGLTMSGTTLTASGATVADSNYGDITVSSSGLNWAINLSAVTYDKIQDMNHTRMLGRKTGSGDGPPEEITISDSLDWTSGASPAYGDILYRSGSSWYRLAAGTSGQFLQTQGVGSSPQWATPTVTDPELSAIAGLTSAADTLPYFTGSGTASTAALTSAGRSVIAGANAAAQRATLGLAIGTDVQAFDTELAAIAGLTSAADTLPYFSGIGTASTTSLTSAGRTLIGGANAAAQRTSLGLVIGTDVQAFDADLSAVAGLSTSGLVARTGAGTAASRSITGPAAGITVSNGDGVSGNPTLALANDLSAVEGLSGTGIARRTGTDTWSVGTTVSIAEGGTGQTSAKAAFDALNGAEATVASAATTDIGAASSDKVSITGTTTITGFGTATAGIRREGRFTGALLLTHNATSLILPGGASITTAAGDRFTAYSLGSGNWVVTSYTTASRTGTGADVQQNSPNFTGSPQVNGNDIGTLDILQNSQSANYTLVLGDRGKQIFHPSSDANSRTFTIPANASVAFPIGSTVTFINASANSCTIAITTDTLRKAGTGTTGSVTLPQHAVATITKVTTTEWYISGNGI